MVGKIDGAPAHRRPLDRALSQPGLPLEGIRPAFRAAGLFFLGLSMEYATFVERYGSVWYRPTANLLEMAQAIAHGGVFVGNQSVGYALAEAMKVPAMLEAYPPFLDCRFSRENAQEIVHQPPDWNWLKGRLDSAPTPGTTPA